MKIIIYSLLIMISISGCIKNTSNRINTPRNTMEWKINPTIDKNTSELYIPENLNSSIEELNKMLLEESVEEIKNKDEEEMIIYHHSLGMWLRNNWKLWDNNSRLTKYFNGLGIKHPDDMSGIILDSYWRDLNNKPINLEEQVKYYQEYWKKRKLSK